MLTLNVTNRIIMKITVWLIPTRQRFDNCLLKKFNYTQGQTAHTQDTLRNAMCRLVPTNKQERAEFCGRAKFKI
jgi:hypothetical protein